MHREILGGSLLWGRLQYNRKHAHTIARIFVDAMMCRRSPHAHSILYHIVSICIEPCICVHPHQQTCGRLHAFLQTNKQTKLIIPACVCERDCELDTKQFYDCIWLRKRRNGTVKETNKKDRKKDKKRKTNAKIIYGQNDDLPSCEENQMLNAPFHIQAT